MSAPVKARPKSAAQLADTTKIGEAQFAYCPECDQWLGCQYWSLSHSVALHKRGTGHKVVLKTLVQEEAAWSG